MNTKKRFYFLSCLSVVALGSVVIMSGCQDQADKSTLDSAPPPKADAVKPVTVPAGKKKGQGSMSAAASSPQGGNAAPAK